MRAKFLDDDAVHFIAGRLFTHDGKQYFPGEPVDDARDWKNLESAVRSRHLWAVAEDPSALPLSMVKDVKALDFALTKLRADKYADDIAARDAEPEQEPGFDPTTHKISEVLDYLGLHPEEAEAVLERERASAKPRVRLITELEERLTAPEETIDV